MTSRQYAMQDMLHFVNDVYRMARRCPKRSTERAVLLSISRDFDRIREQLQKLDAAEKGEPTP